MNSGNDGTDRWEEIYFFWHYGYLVILLFPKETITGSHLVLKKKKVEKS